jgi:hypothetical protein
MHIAIIAPPWLPVPAPAYGGTEAVLDELARGLQAAGHEVLLICHPYSQYPPKTPFAWDGRASNWNTSSVPTSW